MNEKQQNKDKINHKNQSCILISESMFNTGNLFGSVEGDKKFYLYMLYIYNALTKYIYFIYNT